MTGLEIVGLVGVFVLFVIVAILVYAVIVLVSGNDKDRTDGFLLMPLVAAVVGMSIITMSSLLGSIDSHHLAQHAQQELAKRENIRIDHMNTYSRTVVYFRGNLACSQHYEVADFHSLRRYFLTGTPNCQDLARVSNVG